MVQQVLAPGVQHGEEADLGAQVLGVGGDRAQGLGRRAEQDAVDDLLVLVGDGGDFLRHGEDDVEVLGVEELGAAILQPLGAGQRLALRAVPIPAAVVGDALVAALIALLDMAAQRRRAAALDRGHDAALRRGQGRVVPLDDRRRRSGGTHPPLPAPIGPWPGAQKCAGAAGVGFDRDRAGQQVERAGRRADRAGGDAQVVGRGRQAAVAEQQLDGAHVGAGFQQVDREGVAQRMRGDRLGEAGQHGAPCGRRCRRRPG